MYACMYFLGSKFTGLSKLSDHSLNIYNKISPGQNVVHINVHYTFPVGQLLIILCIFKL